MVNPKELRIGNTIRVIKDGRIINVDYITVDIGFPEMYFVNDFSIDELEPIPITNEWLIKFGFNPTYDVNKSFYITVNNIRLEISDSPSPVFGKLVQIKTLMTSMKYLFQFGISSVNQLQNLYFELIRTELTLK